MSRLRICLLAALSAVVSASVSYDLAIVNEELAPDGFTRLTTVADYRFPGPLLRATKGEEVIINVIDELENDSLDVVTSIHWHGLFQKHTNYDDGPAFVSQCPIIPREAFQYKFAVTDQAGTYWYHSHYRTQYCDGLRGAFIVEDPEDPQSHLYDVDNDETVITIADWYHYLSTNAPPISAFNSTLINGKGRYPGGPEAALAVVGVKKELRYRFRLISMSCDPAFLFSIDSHQFQVIEVDGNNVQPLMVDSLEIYAGQRYSVVLKADQPVGNYWIRVLPTTATVKPRDFSNSTNVAILRYEGAHHQHPTPDSNVSVPTSRFPLVETNLHPLVSTPVPGRPIPGGADINIQLDVAFNFTSALFQVNGVAFNPPTVPVLLQILSGAKKASDLYPKGSIYGLEPNKSVEISIPTGPLTVGLPHPIHMHGHAFSVVRSAGNSTYNFDNPVIRDVVSIGNIGDNVTIRFTTDNPGPWMLHCHINWHLNAGFAVVLAEDVPDVSSEIHPTYEWENLCRTYDKFVNPT